MVEEGGREEGHVRVGRQERLDVVLRGELRGKLQVLGEPTNSGMGGDKLKGGGESWGEGGAQYVRMNI